jgi:serine/threonine-protein kinase/endoribonuclease IRE1
MLLSDFGLSKKLADDQSSFHATVQSGTIGWRAPECILNDEVAKLKSTGDQENMPKGIKITKAIDIFAAGCVFYYVLTDGKHPFGTRMLREMNIVQNNVDLSALESKPLAQDLVRRMISRDPSKRPTATQVLAHPYFWEASKRLTFLLDVSDHLERENRHSHPTNRALEACRSVIYNGHNAWSVVVDQLFWDDLSKFRKYFGNSVQDLLRAMRNKRHHFQELDPELKELLGESPETYLGYFERHFPKLLLQVYLILETSPFRANHPFKDVYFLDA